MAKFYSKEEIDFLKKYAPKIGAALCAEKLNRNVNSIRSKLSRLKISSNIDPSFSKDELSKINFQSSFRDLNVNFNSSKTPKELAYFLGFFWADGYVREKDNNIIIEIVEDDANNLKPIFDRLATFSIYKRKREGRRVQMSFRYKSKEIVQFFVSLGKYAHSVESHKKILGYIPECYHVYFLRGLIDGDGNFYSGNKGCHQFSIASSINQDWDSLALELGKLGLNMSISTTSSESGNSSHLRCSNTKNIKKFIKFLYKVRDNIWLTRKYNKAMAMLNIIEEKIANQVKKEVQTNNSKYTIPDEVHKL